MISDDFIYSFTLDEAKSLVLFLRIHEDMLPEETAKFYGLLERYVYNSMTIDEAERFFL